MAEGVSEYRGLVFVDAYCSQSNRFPLQSWCMDKYKRWHKQQVTKNNPIIPYFIKRNMETYNGRIFPASSCLLLQNGSRKHVECICITATWLADGSAASTYNFLKQATELSGRTDPQCISPAPHAVNEIRRRTEVCGQALTYRRSALISTVHCQNSLCAPTGNELQSDGCSSLVFFFLLDHFH